MQRFEYIVQAPEGIHAKPAMMLMKFANSISAQITVSYNGRSANARNIMALFRLGARQGAKVTFTVEGDDESEAIESLKDFCKRNI